MALLIDAVAAAEAVAAAAAAPDVDDSSTYSYYPTLTFPHLSSA